jgi:hypothetical protein
MLDMPAAITAAPTTTVHHEPDATTTSVASHAFSVVQFWRSCDSDPPYEEFSSESRPGTVIALTSAHGSGPVVIGADGHWDLNVIFASAPVGLNIQLGLDASAGDHHEFLWIRTG